VRLISVQPNKRRARRGLSQRNGGFTIVELMIASSVFAVLLLVISAGVMSFTRQYYKGVVTTKTQTTARSIMSEVTQAIQFSSTVYTGLSSGSGSEKGFCVDNKLFSYIIGQQVMDKGGLVVNHQGYHGFVVDSGGSSCTTTTVPMALPLGSALGPGQRELLGDKMRLAALNISVNGDLYLVRVRVLYGQDSVLSPAVTSVTDWSKEACANDSAGSQYCAVSDLTTTIQKRLQ